MVELLDPGLGEDHQHTAGLNLFHELFLQRGHGRGPNNTLVN